LTPPLEPASSGSLAMFAAIRRASSLLSNLAADRRSRLILEVAQILFYLALRAHLHGQRNPPSRALVKLSGCRPTMIISPKLSATVEEAQRIVWEQKGRIIRRRAAGLDSLDAERTLRVLEANLKVLQEHARWLERKEH